MPPGIYPRKGHSIETRQKIAEGNTGKVFTAERRKAISIANKKKIDHDTIEKIRLLLDKKVCNINAVLEEVKVKDSRALRRVLNEANVSMCNSLKFFNTKVSYDTGKKLLAYLKLGLHPNEICKRLDIKRKLFASLSTKLQIAHDFKYDWTRKKPGCDGQSQPEKQTCKILDEIGVAYTKEYHLGNFYFDIHINDTSLLIEVQGDYWHANPLVYQDRQKLNSVQKSNLRRDNYKRIFAKQNGFYTLYIWENDLKNNADIVKETLKTYTRRAYEKAENC